MSDSGIAAVAGARMLAALPRASLHRVRGAGHLLALDRPAAVARIVAEHLRA